MYDLLIKNGTVVTEKGSVKADLAVSGGRIAAIGCSGVLRAEKEFDASGCYVMPGGIDVHVHFDEPGFSDFEDFRCGSAAAAAGGITSVADMPIDCRPANISREAFRLKKECAKASAVSCYYWAGLTGSSLDRLGELANEGASGYKVFLSETGSDDYPRSDDAVLYEGLAFAASKNLPVVFHAENQDMIDFYRSRYDKEQSCMSWKTWGKIRSTAGETEAIRRACFFAHQTGARIHIAHVSCREGIEEIQKQKDMGTAVTAETCSHYLYFSEEDYETKGALIKCAPPLRDAQQKEKLWEDVINGRIDMISSDHSPCSPRMLENTDVSGAWAGISGIQFTIDVLYNKGVLRRNMTMEQLVRIFSANPARLLGIYGKKGTIALNSDADFFVFRPTGDRTVCEKELYTKVKSSAYLGEHFTGHVVATFVGGNMVYEEAEENEGRFNHP